MGIKNLHKTLLHLFIKKNLKDYSGYKIGIDGYCWLHKSIFCDNMDLATNPESKSYLYFIKAKVQNLLNHNIKPIFIFDGNKLPIKNKEESYREYKRLQKVEQAKKLFEQGKEDQAKNILISSIDITPNMVKQLTNILTSMNVEFIVAPYEADAQLAYLDYIHYIDAIITEDSDLIAYGCKKLLYKLDNNNNCMEINYNDIFTFKPQNKKILDFTEFTHEMFLQFCILSGCDYFKANNIGNKKAHYFISKYGSFNLAKPNMNPKKYNLPEGIELQFEKAYLTFLFQVVYCPINKKMLHLNNHYFNEICSNYSFFSFLGIIKDDNIAESIATAKINPITLDILI